MKKLYLLFATVLTAGLLQAQPVLIAVDQYTLGGPSDDSMIDFKLDAQGNRYITGYFSGTIDADPGPGVHMISTPPGHVEPDAFVKKLDPNGNLVWVKTFSSVFDGRSEGFNLALDDSGHVYVLGNFNKEIRFTPTGDLWFSNTTSTFPMSPFLVKLDTAGTVLWGRAWRTPNAASGFVVSTVAATDYGKVFVCGGFWGTIDFSPFQQGNFRTSISTATGFSSANGFVMEVHSNGDVGRVQTTTSATATSSFINDVKQTSGDKLTLVGIFEGTIDFDWGAGVQNRSSSGNSNTFVLQLDTGLSYQWVSAFIGGYQQRIGSVLTNDDDGNIYVSGRNASGIINFSPNTGNTVTHSGSYSFIAKLTSNGGLNFVKFFDGFGLIRGIEVNANGTLLAAGHFLNNFVITGTTPTKVLTSNGSLDGFVYLADTAGSFITAGSFGGSLTEFLWPTAFTPQGTVVVGGETQSPSMDVNPLGSPSIVVNNGGTDMFFVEYQLCYIDTVPLTVTSCGPYTTPSGTATHTSSGVYYDVLQNANGCDSVLALQVTILPLPNVGVIVSPTAITAINLNQSYQWIDCQANQPIPGATNRIFEPVVAGSYAVIVDDGQCADTSRCVFMANISAPIPAQPHFAAYPNPTTGVVQLESDLSILRIAIQDLSGRTIQQLDGHPTQLDLSRFASGIYFLQLTFEGGGVTVKKVVRE